MILFLNNCFPMGVQNEIIMGYTGNSALLTMALEHQVEVIGDISCQTSQKNEGRQLCFMFFSMLWIKLCFLKLLQRSNPKTPNLMQQDSNKSCYLDTCADDHCKVVEIILHLSRYSSHWDRMKKTSYINLLADFFSLRTVKCRRYTL